MEQNNCEEIRLLALGIDSIMGRDINKEEEGRENGKEERWRAVRLEGWERNSEGNERQRADGEVDSGLPKLETKHCSGLAKSTPAVAWAATAKQIRTAQFRHV